MCILIAFSASCRHIDGVGFEFISPAVFEADICGKVGKE